MLRRYNLNLAPILHELLRTRSVSRTAELVGLSQPAVSAALGRLRAIFDDPLLVAQGRNLVLTPRGAMLLEPAERAMAELEALFQPPVFDPASQSRRFVLASADYIAMLMAARMTELLSANAPRASVAFIDVPATLVSELVHGVIDVAILPERIGLDDHELIDHVHLFSDEMVVIASRRIRSFEGPLTEEIYEKAQHAAFQMSRQIDPNLTVTHMTRPFTAHHNLVMVQQFASLPAIVESTGCLALVQRRLALRLQRLYEIDIFPPPFAMEPLEIGAYFARSAVRDDGHGWFLEQLRAAVPEEA